MHNTFILLGMVASCLAATKAQGQLDLVWDNSIPVTELGAPLSLAWAGGLHAPQFSTIDLNEDGIDDLFIFDRSGNQVITLINQGVEGEVSYVHTREYRDVAPFRDLHDWVLLRDYDLDGKPDIFTYTLGGFGVYRNTSDGNGPSFELMDTLVRSNYQPTMANLFVTQIDLPGLVDVDGDGDLDVLTFSIFGSTVEYHKNLSMELYGTADSLVYEVANRCWGFFTENVNNNSVTLNNPCSFNVPDPEIGQEVLRMTEEIREARTQGIPETAFWRARAHSGSTLMPLDLNGDGVMDLVLGDVSFTNMAALFNGGTVDGSFMTEADTLFPNYDLSVMLENFPAGFYLDVDNDGMRDMVVAPNATSVTQNHRSVYHYRNAGTDASPVFEYQGDGLLQSQMLDLGEGAYPVPFDHNGDGLMDLIVANFGYFQTGGSYPSQLALLENVGTPDQPAFDLVDRDYMGLSSLGLGPALYPAFGDLDGDGDQDMIVGDLQGRLHFFRNVATGTVAEFELEQVEVTDDQGGIIDVGQFATPQFFDMDGDGLLDMLIGERNGNVNWYRNSGTMEQAAWAVEMDSIGGVDVTEWWNITGFSVPFMFLNEDGEREMLVGSEAGWIHHYTGIEDDLYGEFELADSTFLGLREGDRSSIALVDIDGNGLLDAFVGNQRGGIGFLRNALSVGLPDHDTSTRRPPFTVYPNPAAGHADIRLEIPWRASMRVTLLDGLGQVVSSAQLTGDLQRLPTDHLANGSYLVRLEDGERQWTDRLVLIR